MADMAVMWLEEGIDAVPRSKGGRTGPAGELFAATTTEVRWAEDWKSSPATAAHTSTNATPRPICQGRRWCVPVDRRRPPRFSGCADPKVGRAGAVDVTMGAPVPQSLTDSIWVTRNDVDAS